VPAMEQGLEDMFLELTANDDTAPRPEPTGRRRKGGRR